MPDDQSITATGIYEALSLTHPFEIIETRMELTPGNLNKATVSPWNALTGRVALKLEMKILAASFSSNSIVMPGLRRSTSTRYLEKTNHA